MTRILDDWLAGYTEFSKNSESPKSYHLWAGVSILASALQRKVFFEWGHSTIYPNQYIVLVGPSALARKGDAPRIGRPFLEHIGINLAPQSVTREALIRLMSESVTSFNYKQNFVFQAPVTVLSAELSVFIGQKNTKFLADLTDIYDSDKCWEYLTKHGDKPRDSITGVCLNLLGATAPDWIPTILPQEAVGGGWTSRVIFVVENEKSRIIADPSKHPPNKILEQKLKKDLEKIHQMTGEMFFTPEAKASYVAWYEKQEEQLKTGTFPIKDVRFAGYVGRRATHVKKIAMCVSASRNDDLLITIDDFERSKDMLEKVEAKMPSAFRGMGKSEISEAMEAVIAIVTAKRKIKRSELLSMMFLDIDIRALEQIEQLLSYMKLVTVTILPNENDKLYTYHDPTSSRQNLANP